MKLTDQGGNELSRFSAAGVKRVLMNPTRCRYDDAHNDYALVWCREAETFIMRQGYGKTYTLKIIYWQGSDEELPATEEEFSSSNRDEAIKRFLTLCKRKPLYANNTT